jgi:uncharacterized protein (DUF58 family)
MADWLNRSFFATQPARPARVASLPGAAPTANLTLRWVVLTGLTYGLILLGLLTLRGEVLALAFPLALYWLMGLVAGPAKAQLIATRQLSTNGVACGVPVTIGLTLTNAGETLEQVEIDDLLPLGVECLSGERRRLWPALAPGESAHLEYTVRAGHGVYPFASVRVTVSDHLGLSTRRLTLPAPAELTVWPQVLPLPRLALRPRHTGVYAGFIPTRQGGSGLAFFGVREYQPGDSLRHINWHTVARHPQALFSNEFQQERATDIGLILDVRQRSYALAAPAAFFEQSVTTVASLAQTFLADGNRVGVMLYGRFLLDWTFPGYGRPQRERILRALARAEISAQHAFDRLEYLPKRLFTPGSQIVFVSPLLKEDAPVLVQLRARGYAVLVISPDPVAYEAEQLSQAADAIRLATRIARLERRLLLERLQQSGVGVLDWDVGQPLDQAMRGFARTWARGQPPR